VRIWCGPYPALARVAALDMDKNRLIAQPEINTDMQALIPYSVYALGDPSKRVRQAAAGLMTVLANTYSASTPDGTTWGVDSLYGTSSKLTTVSSELAAKLIHLQILPAIEECIMDPEHISVILGAFIATGKYHKKPDPSIEKKDHISQSARSSLLSFFASHTVSTHLLLVKDRLLKFLN